MRSRLVLGLLCAALVLLLLATLPARVLPWVLSGDELRVSGLSGSLWRGKAARAVLQTPKGVLHLGRLHWRLYPTSLLRLSPTLAVQSAWGGQRIASRVALQGAALNLRDLDATLDAALLRHWFPVAVSGRVELLFSELRVASGKDVTAQGQLVWRGATLSSGGRDIPLGTYVAVAGAGEGGSGLTASIDTLEGPVRARGSVELEARRYLIDLQLQPARGALDPALSEGLSLIASPVENGYLLRLNGELD